MPAEDRPPFDPWLAHLRRDRRGLPVPYVNRWGPEVADRMSVAYCRYADGDAIFLDDAGEEVPDFTHQNMGRQRECMAGGLCQVCARPVPWSRRNLVIAPDSVEWVRVAGRVGEVPVVFEPWLDDRCAQIALQWCPALIRRRRGEQLDLVQVRSPRDAQLVVSTGWVDGHLEARTRANHVAMWIKVVLLRHQILQARP